jgi:hypothetical protein
VKGANQFRARCVWNGVRIFACAALAVFPLICHGQSVGDCARPFEARLQPGKQIAMHIRSGDLDITGTTENLLRVTCKVSTSATKISFAAGDLRIYDGPDHDAHFRIAVPQRTNLLVRMPAGNVNISGIAGDKDIELRAGNLTMTVGPPESYRVAECSVLAGNLRAEPFGVLKEGLFRNFRKDYSRGQYRLHVDLLAGNLTLK